ncbi:MAG: hypothetical protein ACKPER_12100, partial [Dolichospermum sp.]
MRSFKSSHHQKFEPEKLWCGHIFNQPHPQPPPRKQGGGYDVLHNKGICCNSSHPLLIRSCKTVK